jgi:hypothetical protein
MQRKPALIAITLGAAALLPLARSIPSALPSVQAAPPSDAAGRARCMARLTAAIKGVPATAAERVEVDPQSKAEAMLKSAQFQERFARFFNAEFNPSPGTSAAEDAPYYMAKHVLAQGLPYKDIFLGKFDLGGTPAAPTVEVDPQGLGYFRTTAWQVRYAGNEVAGIKLVTAYQIMNNVIGLHLTAVSNAEGADVSKSGRTGGACAGCHFQRWSALDKVASILTVRDITNTAGVTFKPKTTAEIDVAGEKVTDDASLVARLVRSENFSFNACRISFKFLYGRPEHICESKTFDACVDAFKASGKIESALATVAKDQGFCQ